MAFIDVIRQRGSEKGLLPLIEKAYVRRETKPPLDKRDYSVRASYIPMMCPREEVLCALHNVSREDNVDATLNIIFLHGTALHWGVQNRLLPEIGAIHGMWRCLGCGTVHDKPDESKTVDQWVIRRPARCGEPLAKTDKACESAEFEYVEHQFSDESLRLTGHCDGFLTLPGISGMGVLELKSVGGKNALSIKTAPMLAHIIQAHVYMMFTGFQWGVILYWVKSAVGPGTLVEHFIERDEETIQMIRKSLMDLQRGLNTGELPDRVCNTSTCPRATKCGVVGLCFSDAHAI